MQITIDPVVFHIGSFAVRWYNIIMVATAAAGLIVLLLEAKRLQLPRIHAVQIFMWSILVLIVFGRLFIYWDKWDYYSADFSRMITLTGGRLDGAVFGFLLLILIYSRFTKYSFWYLGDVITMDMAVCIAVGRWACLVNGCCYGLPCELPWAVIYTNPNSRAPLDLPLHPVQLYQIILYSLVFIGLWLVRKRLKPQGSLLLIFLMLHAAGDYVTRIFRDDNEFFFGMQQAHLLSLVILAIAVPLYIIRLRNYRRHPALSAENGG
jgi:phosphatidylglycerol---prolipoprotein diacylglyceryl transferase